MATNTGCGDSEYLTADDIREYGFIAAGNYTGTTDNPRVRKLVDWGFVAFEPGRPDRPVALDPKTAARRRFTRELEKAAEQVELLRQLPGLVDSMGDLYRAGHMHAGGSSQYLGDPALVNARLQDAVGGARREILAAQPGGPRSRDLLDIAVERDAAALDRGVELRTMYRDTVRDHPVTAEYAQIMSTREPGGRAQYRTLPGTFERMIIVDREQAFLSDHIVSGAPPHAAWHVTDAPVVVVLARMFDFEWLRARPWSGALRSRRGDARDTVGSAHMPGVRTTRRQREIMRNLCGGRSQASTARRIGVSERKLAEEIAALKGLWGVSTMNELIYQWAQSVDNKVDDTAADGLAGMEYEQTA